MEKIADLGKERVKLFNTKSRVASYFIYILSGITGGAISYFFFFANNPIVGSWFISFGILFPLLFDYVNKRQKSTIKLIPKHEAPNFFKANSDKPQLKNEIPHRIYHFQS